MNAPNPRTGAIAGRKPPVAKPAVPIVSTPPELPPVPPEAPPVIEIEVVEQAKTEVKRNWMVGLLKCCYKWLHDFCSDAFDSFGDGGFPG